MTRDPRPGSARVVRILGLALGAVAYRSVILGGSGAATPGLEAWLATSVSTPPQLVLALSALLVVLRRRELGAPRVGRASWLAAPGLATALGLFTWAELVGAVDLEILSLAPLVLACGYLLRGTPAVRRLALPIGLLAFAIPLPGVLANRLVFELQLWTTAVAAWLLGLAGIPAIAEGEMLVLAGRAVEVIESCSGLGPIKVLSLLAVAYVALVRPPGLHASLLVLAAPPIAFVTNALRVAIVGWQADAPLAAAHTLHGVLLFLVGAALLLLLDRLLESVLPPRPAYPRDAAPGSLPAAAPSARLLLVTLAAMAVVSVALPRWRLPDPPAPWSVQPPAAIDGWRREPSRPDFEFLGTVRFAWSGHWFYVQHGAEPVTVFVGFDDLAHRERSIFSPRNALPGRGWTAEEHVTVADLVARAPAVHSTLAHGYAQRSLSYYAYSENRGTSAELLRAALALDQSPLHRPDGVRFLRLSTPLAPTEGALADAHARLRYLFSQLAPLVFADGASKSHRPPG